MNTPPAHDYAPGGMAASRLKILFVDDHRDTRIVMEKLLQQWGYQVHTADSVESALGIARAIDPDLLISDIELPDGTGIDLLRTLRSTTSIPGIVHSGYGMEEDVMRSLEAGFFEHLIKPVALPKLRETISRLLTGGSSPDSSSRMREWA